MKLFIVCGVFLVVFLFTRSTEARKNNGKGRGAGGNNNSTMECLGQNISEPEWNLGFTECTQEMVSNQQDLADKPQKRRKAIKRNQMCIKLCQRKKQGILDSNGKLSETGSNRFVDLFPQKSRVRITRGLTRCAEDHVDGFAVTNNCKEYKRFEKCMTRIISKACGLKNDKQNGRGGKNAARRNGNKGKNKNNRRQQSENSEHHEEDEDSEVEE